LRYGNINVICHAITTGKISAWIIYNCHSGREFLGKISSDQLGMIYDYINPEYWQNKFVKDSDNTRYCQDILKQAGW